MCIETNNSALRKLIPLRDQFAAMSPEDKALYRLPEDALGAIHFRAVERIYGDQGPQIVELMKKNPTVAVPVIITRLEQKAQEWLKVGGTVLLKHGVASGSSTDEWYVQQH